MAPLWCSHKAYPGSGRSGFGARNSPTGHRNSPARFPSWRLAERRILDCWDAWRVGHSLRNYEYKGVLSNAQARKSNSRRPENDGASPREACVSGHGLDAVSPLPRAFRVSHAPSNHVSSYDASDRTYQNHMKTISQASFRFRETEDRLGSMAPCSDADRASQPHGSS